MDIAWDVLSRRRNVTHIYRNLIIIETNMIQKQNMYIKRLRKKRKKKVKKNVAEEYTPQKTNVNKAGSTHPSFLSLDNKLIVFHGHGDNTTIGVVL